MTSVQTADTLYDIPLKDIDGQPVSLEEYLGKVLLIVNVASKCGFTPQYAGLEALYQKYKDQAFTVLGFPCNQFGRQEPGTNEEIKQFCSTKFRVSFPLFEKIEVNGKKPARPLCGVGRQEFPFFRKDLVEFHQVPGQSGWQDPRTVWLEGEARLAEIDSGRRGCAGQELAGIHDSGDLHEQETPRSG